VAHLLGAESIGIDFPTKHVLASVSIGVSEGDRIGVVGRNGDGKSTLLKILAGRLTPDTGQVTSRAGVHVGMLDQADELAGAGTVREVLGQAFENSHDGSGDWRWLSEPRTRDIIAGLVPDVDLERSVDTLSGGQRRRVALARLLLGEADVILLDEPTNHLDIQGVTWLADHLRSRWAATAGALLVVTHDRWFLDEVCGTTWEVHDAQVEPFEGGYAAWVLQRAERNRTVATMEAKRQNLLRKELAWLRRGAPARTAKPKFRIEAANQLISTEPPVRDTVELSRLATARLGKDVVDLVDVDFSFGDITVLQGIEWRIGPGDRFALLGANGVGKTTLLNLITGDLQPQRGRAKRGSTVKFASLTQQLAELDDVGDQRITDLIARRRTTYATGGKELTPGQLLERLGFTSAQLVTPVKDLSGGQRRRLQLLLILLDEPNVLMMDEPTNDMDTDMLAAVEDLLDTWPGTLIVASHDRYLLERVTDHQYALIDGRLRHLPGGIDQYLTLVNGPEVRPSAASSRQKPQQRWGGDNGDHRDNRKLRKQVGALDRRMTKLTGEVAALHEQMVGHDPTDYPGLAGLDEKARSTAAELVRVESDWLEMSTQLEG